MAVSNTFPLQFVQFNAGIQKGFGQEESGDLFALPLCPEIDATPPMSDAGCDRGCSNQQ